MQKHIKQRILKFKRLTDVLYLSHPRLETFEKNLDKLPNIVYSGSIGWKNNSYKYFINKDTLDIQEVSSHDLIKMKNPISLHFCLARYGAIDLYFEIV